MAQRGKALDYMLGRSNDEASPECALDAVSDAASLERVDAASDAASLERIDAASDAASLDHALDAASLDHALDAASDAGLECAHGAASDAQPYVLTMLWLYEQMSLCTDFIQADITHNTTITFLCGILSSGMFGGRATCFALSFGLNCLRFRHLNTLSACIGAASLLNADFRCIGSFHFASMLFGVCLSRRISPYAAYGLTLGMVGAVVASPMIALWLTIVYIYETVCMWTEFGSATKKMLTHW